MKTEIFQIYKTAIPLAAFCLNEKYFSKKNRKNKKRYKSIH